MFVGTFLISFVALCVAAPIGLLSAIYLAEYASIRTRSFLKPLLEILAGVPTVVYGFFAAITVGPFFKDSDLRKRPKGQEHTWYNEINIEGDMSSINSVYELSIINLY